MSPGVMRPQTALRAMLVGMELVAARRVSARVSVELVGTRHHRQLLVHRHRTASRAMQAATGLEGVQRVNVPVIVWEAHSRLARLLPVLHHQTALRARWDTLQTSAAAAVLPVRQACMTMTKTAPRSA
eukprot:COSAG06_NODE_4893_length_3877_cov_5.358391_5_plen_128_part_00